MSAYERNAGVLAEQLEIERTWIDEHVGPTLIIASGTEAGGIGRGRQVAASFCLGAQGVWTDDPLLAATPRDTVRSKSLSGTPALADVVERLRGPSPLPRAGSSRRPRATHARRGVDWPRGGPPA